MSVSTENFIKAVYKLEQGLENETRPGSVARSLGVSNAAATDMARKLASRELINYEKYRSITLTEQGKLMALSIIRKHRLWECFLSQVFDLSIHEIHREAEMLEHQTSDFLEEKLREYLGNPQFDPHGDPIPDARGDIHEETEILAVSYAIEGKLYTLSRLYSSEEDFLKFCDFNNLMIGVRLKVVTQYESSKMTEIKIHDKKIVLNHEFSSNIYVKELT
jgi:DtxR family Mn-dependent transcriptional regulator